MTISLGVYTYDYKPRLAYLGIYSGVEEGWDEFGLQR